MKTPKEMLQKIKCAWWHLLLCFEWVSYKILCDLKLVLTEFADQVHRCENCGWFFNYDIAIFKETHSTHGLEFKYICSEKCSAKYSEKVRQEKEKSPCKNS